MAAWMPSIKPHKPDLNKREGVFTVWVCALQYWSENGLEIGYDEFPYLCLV